MTRFKLTLEYDGGPFVGWQRQDNGMSVQQALEEAVFKTCAESVTAHGAGRTDAGVHATGQVAHIDVDKEFEPEKLQAALNFHLRPWPVAIVAAEIAPPDFHARFSATGRAYLYRIVNRRPPLTLDEGRAWLVNAPLDPGAMHEAAQVLVGKHDFHARFSATGRAYLYRIINRRPPLSLEEGRAWLVNAPLDAEAMHEAAQLLVGKHDFSTFRASLCQAQSPVKTLTRLEVARAGEEIRIVAEARSFLHHQVRNMVGTLRLVGEGKWSRDDVRTALEARDRTKGGPTAPPQGLYLTAVRYDPS